MWQRVTTIFSTRREASNVPSASLRALFMHSVHVQRVLVVQDTSAHKCDCNKSTRDRQLSRRHFRQSATSQLFQLAGDVLAEKCCHEPLKRCLYTREELWQFALRQKRLKCSCARVNCMHRVFATTFKDFRLDFYSQ